MCSIIWSIFSLPPVFMLQGFTSQIDLASIPQCLPFDHISSSVVVSQPPPWVSHYVLPITMMNGDINVSTHFMPLNVDIPPLPHSFPCTLSYLTCTYTIETDQSANQSSLKSLSSFHGILALCRWQHCMWGTCARLRTATLGLMIVSTLWVYQSCTLT